MVFLLLYTILQKKSRLYFLWMTKDDYYAIIQIIIPYGGKYMKVSSTKSGNTCSLAVEGRIDTLTAPALEKEVTAQLPGCEKMIFDFSSVEYISSAGLRVLVFAQQELASDGEVVLKGLNANIAKMMTMTGLNNIFKIEK